MHEIRIAFLKDKRTGLRQVCASCNNGPMYVECWCELSDEMHMILRALANPDKCRVEVLEKGFDEINIDD